MPQVRVAANEPVSNSRQRPAPRAPSVARIMISRRRINRERQEVAMFKQDTTIAHQPALKQIVAA